MKRTVSVGLLAGLVLLLAGLALNMAMNVLAPGLKSEYENSGIFRPWSDPLMSLYFLYPFLFGVLLAWVWRRVAPLQISWNRFAGAVFLVYSIPGMLITYASFQVSLGMVLSWTLSGLIDAGLASYLFAKFLKS
ncbi:MAG: hypothetical protein HY978_00060 [Candidatus Liptonbacteria bacterium]|nr:hypothetical protein [Candidatus Liptonbacteria bacterium]